MSEQFHDHALSTNVRQRGEGAAAFILVGTAGVKRGIKTLEQIALCDHQNHVGAIAVIDFDSRAIAYWESNAPLKFRERAVTTRHASKPLGFKSDPPAIVLEEKSLWEPEVEDTLNEFVLRQLACQEDGTDPGLLLIYGSGGGHAEVTVTAARDASHRFPQATIVVSYPVPGNTRQRSWARQTIEKLLASGVDQVVLQDDRIDAAAHDVAWADLVAGMICGFDANNLQDVAAINLFSHAAPAGSQQAHIGVVEARRNPLPAKLIFHADILGRNADLFGLRVDVVQTKALHLARQLQSSLGMSLREQRVHNAALIRVVAAELDAESLRRVATKVFRTLKWDDGHDWETELIFAPLTGPYPPVPERPTVNLSVVDYYLVADSSPVLDHVFATESGTAQPQRVVDPELTIPVHPAGPQRGDGNSHHGERDYEPHRLSVRLNAHVR